MLPDSSARIARVIAPLKTLINRMKRCAFLTLHDPTGFVIDDELTYRPLRNLGWQVEAIPWRGTNVSWTAYDAVVIRSTWDYTEDPAGFLRVLAGMKESGVPLFNDLEVVRWNINKTYLRGLADRGVPIVPTVWRDRLRPGEMMCLFDELGVEELIVKPTVGAGARGVFRLNRLSTSIHGHAELEAYYGDRALMAQPLLETVINEGEYSLFYFDGQFSHTILKTPQPGDFRVQEEHGGHIRPVAALVELRNAAARALRAIGEPPLYARADFVRNQSGDGFWLMELELIEPSLYFRMDPEAPLRFAHALNSHVQRRI